MRRFEKAGSLAVLLACEVGAMAVWFASSAAAGRLQAEGGVTVGGAAWLASALQLGFVGGTLISASLSLADRFDPRRLFAASALTAAVATALLAGVAPIGAAALGLRFITGACMAGVYPVGMRLAVTWARRGAPSDLGLLIGLLVGALALGSASPHLLAAAPGLGWRTIYLAAAGLAAASGLGIGFAGLGPGMTRSGRADWTRMAQAWRQRPLLLANLGYLGHMWELYAMWAWLGAFLTASFRASGLSTPALAAEAAAFAAVGAGAVGSGLGGLLADRYGRTAVTTGAMAISAACALVTGWLFGGPAPLLIVICLIWGVAIVADSAQFSASIAELAEPGSIGTLLTAQTCAGFLLTMVSIQLVPVVVAAVGWGGAFSMLAVGPVLGCWAMLRLRAHPEAARLAGGRR